MGSRRRKALQNKNTPRPPSLNFLREQQHLRGRIRMMTRVIAAILLQTRRYQQQTPIRPLATLQALGACVDNKGSNVGKEREGGMNNGSK
mmetsp:Transcript_5187/g.7788  ORF Transcript_5187/g.7788 Transcript_5187/m.7788 type:complete len:90 (+) Transcript_5187:287-556(+)